jgi:hypothetical protein
MNFIIELKNNASLLPQSEGGMSVVAIKESRTVQNVITFRTEPSLNYGVIIDKNGEGWRFHKHSPNQPVATSEYETQNKGQFLEIQGSEFPIVYVNDNKKSPTVDFEVYTDNQAYRDRMMEVMSKSEYLYIYIPKEWNHSLKTGFYAYESISAGRYGLTKGNGKIWHFSVSGARRVEGTLTEKKDRTWDSIRNSITNYDTLTTQYRDYEDLALVPTSDLHPGEYPTSTLLS